MFDGSRAANYSYRGSQSAWVISRSLRSHLCVLAPVKRLTGVLNRQPGTEQRLLKSAERRSRPPGWVFREQTRATGGSRPSAWVSAHGGRMPVCTHVHSSSAKSDTSLCWRWNAGGEQWGNEAGDGLTVLPQTSWATPRPLPLKAEPRQMCLLRSTFQTSNRSRIFSYTSKKNHLFNSMPLKMVLKRLRPISNWIGSASKTQHMFLPWTWWGCSGKDQQTGKSLYMRNCGLKKNQKHNL